MRNLNLGNESGLNEPISDAGSVKKDAGLVSNCPSDIFFGPGRPVKILCNIRVQER